MSVPLEDNCVRYCLFSSKITDNQQQNETYLSQLMGLISKQVLTYQWNFVPFHLRIVSSHNSHNQVEHFEGISHFDENIEDEWFIVHLLFELSRQDDSLVIQVQDTDGEFLLIEAAELLPRWVKPESVENRSFIYQGQLHLINRKHWPNKITSQDFRKAVQYIRDNHEETACDSSVQTQICKKIDAYPNKIQELTHKTRLVVPLKVAMILQTKPQIISHAVRAFNSRDKHDIQLCRVMKHFQPNDLIERNVRMTKFNYAQLIGQQLKPDKRLNWPIDETEPNQKRRQELGFKVSCGFEILVCEFEQNAFRANENKQSLANDYDSRWIAFLESLKSSGFFENLLEQSTAYEQKMKKAKSYFDEYLGGNLSNENEAYLDSDYLAGKTINEILSEIDQGKLPQSILDLSELSEEESDDWINKVPDYFLEMENAVKSNPFEIGSAIPQKLEQFITKQSDHKGAVLPENKKRNLKERAMEMISDNLRNILAMKVSDSEQESDSDLSDYDHNSNEGEFKNDDADDEREEDRKEKQEYDQTKSKRVVKSICTKTRDRSTRPQLKVTFDDIPMTDEDEGNHEGAQAALEDDPRDSEKLTLKEFMSQMDHELNSTCLAKSFVHRKKAPIVNPNNLEVFDDSDEDDSTRAHASGSIRDSEDMLEVDVELNAAKNILESFKSQAGLAGPSSNLLSSMGLNLPPDAN